jgi:SagB-type dehydrogenase family enzyme
MKANFTSWREVISDQNQKVPKPPLSKAETGNQIIKLPEVTEQDVNQTSVYQALVNRKSHRKYTDDKISITELAYLLYVTQGVKSIGKNNAYTLRTVPSGGARHPFETYLYIQLVDGIKSGIYRYLPLNHSIEFLFEDESASEKIARGTLGQTFVGNCAVTFIWSCVPYRSEWRYHISAHKTMLLDAGHLCQNLYIACEAINCGTCAIAAYDQKLMDQFLKLDGDDEFVVYLAPVGKVQ